VQNPQVQSVQSEHALPAQLRRLRESVQILLGLIVFAVVCLTWTAIALPLLLLPARWGRRIGRIGISRGFRFYFWLMTLMGVFRYDLAALTALRAGPAVVLAPNHPGVMDALFVLAREPRVSCVLKSALLNNVFLGAGARLARYIRHDPAHRMIRSAVAELERGGIVLLFPEGTRTTRAPINPLQSGVGIIAKHAGVPVQTLLIETDSPYGRKGRSLVRAPPLPIRYRMRLGRRFDPPTDVRAFMAELDHYFRQTLTSAGAQSRSECAAPAERASAGRRSSHTG
jgi:1-acyl-sn-glycerol-3-phosphate acyltransferase